VSWFALVWHQFRYDQKTFWRDPTAVGFTVAFPLIFLFMFATIFGNAESVVGGVRITRTTYYVPSIVTLALIGATFFNLSITLTELRESGVLKRVQATPLPRWVFLAGRVITSILVTLLLTAVVLGIGRIVYGVALPGRTLPGLLLALFVGAATFCSLGFALSGLVPTTQAAPAVVNVIALPLEFISGLFIPKEELPDWMVSVAAIFPINPLFESMLATFTPGTAAPGIAWGDLAVVAAWGVAGAVAAAFTFRWAPRRS
jgi:ABC-2 type transport system permease protein